MTEAEAIEMLRKGAARLAGRPGLQRDLAFFVDHWFLESYAPPDHVEECVRSIVRAMLAASSAMTGEQ